MILGAQLYTLRAFTKTPEALAETLRRVAQIGYRSVQVSGTCEFDGAWLGEELKKNGLTCPLTHERPDAIRTDPVGVLEKHRLFGCPRIGIGSAPGGMKTETYPGFVRDFTPAAEVLAENGAKLYYHNHWAEFCRDTDGEPFLSKLTRAFPADRLGIVFDTYWAQFAGADPAEWIRKLDGRVDCVHLKDLYCEDKTQKMMPVGRGSMNFDRILSVCEDVGTRYAFVEQDDCNGEDPFDCLAESYAYLHALGLN